MNLTLTELQALLDLAQRGPLSPAERLWLDALIARLQKQVEGEKA